MNRKAGVEETPFGHEPANLLGLQTAIFMFGGIVSSEDGNTWHFKNPPEFL